ncbi:MAG: class I SAM-dependent DNA methyltransferase [Deltaproteobacteria bacterium]|jgi:hypothetical protein|nr:class I SAM-dependent DNA methyltransferase [Deltaproteobacteria bacterium]
MSVPWDVITGKSIAFSKRWENAVSEAAEGILFVTDFLQVFGVEDPGTVGNFEYKVPLSYGKKGYIDYLWKKQIAIEMKSRGENLSSAYNQLKNYLQHLPSEEIPDLWMVCDFEKIWLIQRSSKKRFEFETRNLRRHIKKFASLAGYMGERIRENQEAANITAAEKMAKLHDELKLHGYVGHDLEVYLVRLLFCLFAEDTNIFPKDSFSEYIESSKPDGSDLSSLIFRLFEVLNMPEEVKEKKKLLSKELKPFCYVDGKLFSERLGPADFDAKMRQTLLDCTQFDWNSISPAIFGAMFQGVMSRHQRREFGAHYTSEENILKLINPLFLDELWAEFQLVKTIPTALKQFHEKLGRLCFLDPACGCGNFLIITYRELRKLELEVIKMLYGNRQKFIDLKLIFRINVDQFYGIEYDDFPGQIAMVGMWLIDHQMNMLVTDEIGQYIKRIPLTESATIKKGNALQIDWETIVPKNKLSYILGNPPFIGGMMMSREQKTDMNDVFGEIKGVGELDYVSAWYKKAADYMTDTNIKAAFVSTNSISQGQQAVTLWKPLHKKGLVINFGYRTFTWSNEAKGKATVNCIIIGFSYVNSPKKFIFDGSEKIETSQINSYLVDAPNIFIDSRSKPLSNVPPMHFGSMPRDGGWFILSDREKTELLREEPSAKKWIRPYIGGLEFINNKSRWCLWLVNANPAEIKQCKIVMSRIEKVKKFREKSKADATRKFAEAPMLFCQIAQPKTEYIAVPRTSSERRLYVPIGFLPATTIASDGMFLIPNATAYHFGILTSNVHNAWMRAICGRLEMRYRYSKDIVYNNFPWPSVTAEQYSRIEKTAHVILDTRVKHTDCSLADLYDPLSMPGDLLEAHQNNDLAVMKAYGFAPRNKKLDESACVSKLMKIYQEMIKGISE